MIRNESVILAEGIALNHAEPIKVDPVIAGLMEVSLGGAAYGDNYRQQIVDVTSENETHGQVLEDVSTRLAEIVRESFGQIRDFAAPFSQQLVAALEDKWLPSSFEEMGFRNLHTEFVCVEHPFFNSLVYPTAVRNTALSFSSVNVSSLLERVSFRAPTREELTDWLNTTHPDVTNIMEDPESCPVNAFMTLVNQDTLEEMFVHEGKVIDFTQVKTLRLKSLFQMYVVLSKMQASPDPVKWLATGSLAEYRELVSLLWNSLTAHLLRVKQLCEAYRLRGIAVMELKPVTLRTVEMADSLNKLAYRELNGKILVLYTNNAIERLSTANHTLRDWVVARYYGRLTEGPSSVTDIGLLEGNKLGALCSQYYGQIRAAMEKNRELVFDQVFRNVVDGFISTTPVVAEYLKAKHDKVLPSTAVIAEMSKDFKWGYRIAAQMNQFSKIDLAVSNSGVATAFLRAIGCDLAASILAGTERQCEEDSALDKRKRLHYAVIGQLARKLLGN